MAMVKSDILDLSIGKLPMLKALLLYVLGILLALLSEVPISPWLILIFMGCIVLLYLLLFQRKKFEQKKIFTVCFGLLVIAYGYYKYARGHKEHMQIHYSRFNALQYVGDIDDEPIVKEKTVRFPVRIERAIDSSGSNIVSGKIMMTVLRDSVRTTNFSYGDRIIFVNKLHDINPPFNPKEFDYKSYLANKGITEQCLLNAAELQVLERDRGNVLIAHSLKLRSYLIAKFRKYIKDDEAFNVAIALIFGYRSQIDQSTISAFTNTGTIHVLSVSGLHVSLVFALLNWTLIWMNRFRFGKTIKSAIILLAIWAYVILTGMSPPILRAGIMISFFVCSLLLNRKQIPLNTLAASAFFILLFAPNYLFEVGFQLSYLAILGIILLYPILRSYYLTQNKWLNYVVEYIYISLAAQLFTLPLTLYYFGQFPNYFLLANLFIALPSTLIMYVGVGLAIIPCAFTNNIFGFLIEWLLKSLMFGLKWIENLPIANIQGIEWSWMQMSVLIIGITALIIALNNRNAKAFLVCLSSIFLLSIFGSFHVFHKSKHKALTFYNIRSEMAIALVRDKKVLLYSSLDSLQHSTLQYSVVPDLKQYILADKIIFQVINTNAEKQNYRIRLGNYTILILESKTTAFPENVDFVLWRKNNYSNLEEIMEHYPKAKILIDGSNSDRTIERLQKGAESKLDRLYILKNNFAYVWQEE